MPHEPPPIVKSAGLISLATIISRILGLVRETLLVALFTRFQTDAFYVAFRIPNLLRDLFAEGAMSAAFVPTFTKTLQRQGPLAAWRLASLVINFLVVVLGVIVLLGIFNASWIVETIAGGFGDQPGKFELTVLLTRIMLPFLLLVALAAVAMGMLNCHGKFFVPALAPATFNLGSILVALSLYWLLPAYGLDPVVGMAVGVIVGGALQVAFQLPSLLKLGFRYGSGVSFDHPGLKKILLLMGPGTFGLAVTQVNLLVNTWLASYQQQGAVTWLNAAFRLMYLPIGIFGVAIASAALPTLSAHAAHHRGQQLRDTLSSSLRLSLFFNVPASLGLICLSHPVVSLIYERGRFTAADTLETGWVLIYYSLGLAAYSAIKLMVPAFYALDRPRIPVLISAATLALSITANVLLIDSMGYQVLALVTSLAALLNAFLLYYWLQKTAGALQTAKILTTFLKVLGASLVMAIGTFYLYRWMADLFLPVAFAGRALILALSVAAGVAIYALGCRLIGVPELDLALDSIRRKLGSN
ncbi:MAG: murein biosynthesis integral membrane protein MurJ [Acidobacteriota bacterium]|nr:murein biosynthesis integral membrane protein MurJ [Acidobacteriota bacterium]